MFFSSFSSDHHRRPAPPPSQDPACFSIALIKTGLHVIELILKDIIIYFCPFFFTVCLPLGNVGSRKEGLYFVHYCIQLF